ncbi:MAG: pseudouridine synthase [Rhodobacteraceae bacterium]|nr:pseudouridine synthase [Paracoccaceae bacterium]
MSNPRLIRFNKPFDVLPQFTDRGTDTPRRTLSEFIDLPGLYPAGRLDRDSEGLMLLTSDGKLQARISDPRHKLEKTYWVQVEGLPDATALDQLAKGVELKDGLTRPAKAKRIDTPPDLWPRDPPIRLRKTVPDCWIELTLTEGRNRQVRRMVAAVGHPCLRLIRARIGIWSLKDLPPGNWQPAAMPDDSRPVTGRVPLDMAQSKKKTRRRKAGQHRSRS